MSVQHTAPEDFVLPDPNSYQEDGEYTLPPEGSAYVLVKDIEAWQPSTYNANSEYAKVVYEILEPEEAKGMRITGFATRPGKVPKIGEEIPVIIYHGNPDSDGRVFPRVANYPPEGSYVLQLQSIGPFLPNKEDPKNGKNCLTFAITDDGEWKGHEVRGYYNTKTMHPKSNIYPVVKALIGKTPDREYGWEDLAGKKMQVMLQHNKGKDGKLYLNIGKDAVAVRSARMPRSEATVEAPF